MLVLLEMLLVHIVVVHTVGLRDGRIRCQFTREVHGSQHFYTVEHQASCTSPIREIAKDNKGFCNLLIKEQHKPFCEIRQKKTTTMRLSRCQTSRGQINPFFLHDPSEGCDLWRQSRSPDKGKAPTTYS
jgi:hypothetical protein